MESEIAHQGLDPNGKNIAHLRALKKDLISKKRECQEDINEATIILDNLYAQKANRGDTESLESSLEQLRLVHKKINGDISELNRKIECCGPKPRPQNRKKQLPGLIRALDAVISNDSAPVNTSLLIDCRSAINFLKNNLIRVQDELADQKH